MRRQLIKSHAFLEAYHGIRKRGKMTLLLKNIRLLDNKEFIKDKYGFKGKSFPSPWNEVAYHVLKYISYDGRFSVVFAYHLILLYQLRHQSHYNHLKI